MPLLDHFHPPLHGPRRWEGFHHAWAANIAQHLNREVLPPDFFAESEISLGPTLEIDVANIELANGREGSGTATAVWTPTKPLLAFAVDFARLDVCEVRIYEDLGGAQLRAAIELVSPANKDRPGSRRTFAAKCAGYLKQGVSAIVIDVVTDRIANLHEELMSALDATRANWESKTHLYAVSYRPVPVQKQQRIEAWPETLNLGQPLPILPLWLKIDLCLPLELEETYLATCSGLRIPC